jgi:hypothetical protein
MTVDAPTWPSAAQTVINKMGSMCPAMPFEIVNLRCSPAPDSQGSPREVGPPWRFVVDIQLITLI